MSLFETELPNGLRWARVGDFYEVTRKPRGLSLPESGLVPFIPMENIPLDGRFEASHLEKQIDSITSGTYFERGDVLVAKITPSFENGKQALIEDLPEPFGYATTEVIPLHAKTDRQVHRVLFYYLLHPEVRSHVAGKMEGSTGRQRVPEDVLLDLPFPEINDSDQAIIADTLGLVQSSIRAEQEAVARCHELKQTAMKSLFTLGLRGEPRKETEIGSVPTSWSVVRFESIREWLQYGTSVPCSSDRSTYPVLRIPNVEAAFVNVSDLKYCDLPKKVAQKYQLAEGDLIFIRTNGVRERLGKCAVYFGEPSNALFASYLIRARVLFDKILPRYAAHFFSSELGTRLVAGGATPAADGKFNLNTASIDSILLPLPPTLDEQKDIVEILEAIDQKIGLHKSKKIVLEQLFQSLLHKLMIGEVRGSDLDLSALETAPMMETMA
jgi:type I restriction enzyme S subunit